MRTCGSGNKASALAADQKDRVMGQIVTQLS